HPGAVGGGGGGRLRGEGPAPLQGGAAGGQRRRHLLVVGRVAGDRHRGGVLGGGAHQRRGAHVDQLGPRGRGRGRARRGGLERVGVEDDQVERGDPGGPELVEVVGTAPVG